MAVDDHSLKRAARVCAGRDQGECRPSNPAQWCTRQGEVGLREGEWSRAYRECDRRRADEEAKHDGDRSRVCDARACASVSSGKSAKASPMASEDFGRARQKRRRYGHIIVPKGVAIEICASNLKIHQNIRDYNRRGPISRGPIIRAPTMYKDSISHSRSRVLFMWLLFSKSWDEKDDRMLSVSFRGVTALTSTLTQLLF